MTEHAARVLDAVEALREPMLAELATVVRIPSVGGTDAENDAQHYIAGRLRESGLDVDHWQLDLAHLTDGSDVAGQVRQGYLWLQPGDIVDSKGVVLGRHCGLAQYTIGQRHGLGIAADQPLYVLKLLVDTNQLLVGREDQLLTSALIASRLTWVSGQAPGANFMATAKIRYRSPEVPVKIRINGNTAIVIFEQPQRAVTPGQSIVFYQGEVVLGGGIIEDSEDATDTNVR